MYIVHSTFEIPHLDKVDEVIDIYKNRSRLVDHASGFVQFQLLQNQKKPNFLTVQLTWKTREDYMRWVTSDDYRKSMNLKKSTPTKN